MLAAKRKPAVIAALIVCCILAIGVIGSVVYMLRQGGSSLPVAGQAPDFSAANVNGETVSMSNLDGKVRLVTWFYSHCPDECPETANYMSEIQDKLKQDHVFGSKVAFMSISIDPKGDTQEAVSKFATRFHADLNGWYFLRPTVSQLPNLLQQWGIQVKETSDPERLEHVIETDLIDQNGNIRKQYTESKLPVAEIENDIHNLLSRGL